MTRLYCARTLAALAILVVTALGGVPAQAQSWPSKPVKIIMATAAGSAPDVIARIVTDRLSQTWGQQVLIINRPGAGGLIALQALAAAERRDDEDRERGECPRTIKSGHPIPPNPACGFFRSLAGPPQPG